MDMLDMTDQQLNRALGEFMGYRLKTLEFDDIYYSVVNPHGLPGPYRYTADEAFLCTVPEYCADPAASLEVQAAAIKANDRQYAINLAKRLEWDGDDLEYSDNDVFSYTGVTVFMLSSPRQRAEAAYMTLSSKDLHPLREDI
ncbi:hypothetical protein EJ573_03000 [Paenibacillus polymyxa]|nr:hypothetical protein EJ573_03000 [Paenibacillus polymyxa]